MFPEEKSSASSSSSHPPVDNKKLAQDILGSFKYKPVIEKNQYLRDGVIVTRCEAWGSMTVNGELAAKTSLVTSGANNQWPGMNWTGIMADIGNKRYGAAKYGQVGNDDEKSRLLSCAEGKCLYDFMSRGIKKLFTKENAVVIGIHISFDSPCRVCDVALQDWVNQYAGMCRSLKLVVHGTSHQWTYGA